VTDTRRVYFIEAGKGGSIKIGVANDVASRLRDLQCANPRPLRLIVAVLGGYADEKRLHHRFKAERTSGEWFKGNGAVRAFATSLIGMSDEEQAVAIVHQPKPSKARRATRRDYTPEEWHSLFFVGDGQSIYRTSEAELVLHERERLGLSRGGGWK
jgi:hypothetical protein